MIYQTTPGERVRAALPVIIVHALMLLAVLGHDPVPQAEPTPDLKVFDVAPDVVIPPAPPPPPPRAPGPREAKRRADPRDEGAAAPPNLTAKASALVAPEPIVPPLVVPMPAAPVSGVGSETRSGAAPVPGPGTGSGGVGNGTGSGRYGGGAGGGGGGGGDGGGGAVTPPRRVRGTLQDSDYPAGLGEAGITGLVSVLYFVQPDGRATDCAVTRSSGSAVLDRTTCRLIEERFRFTPSRDRAGRPVRSRVAENHEWVVEDLPPEHRIEYRRRRFPW